MSVELHSRLHAAAARPSGDAPLPAIEARLRTRRRRRVGALVVCGLAVVALVATASIAVLTGDDGPSVQTVPPAQSTAAAYGEGFTVDLPPGWSRLEVLSGSPSSFVVGSTPAVSLGGELEGCSFGLLPEDAFLVLAEFPTGDPATLPGGSTLSPPIARPGDFTSATPRLETPCLDDADTVGLVSSQYAFVEGGRTFVANLVIGAGATAERRAEAYAVLNSFRLEPDVIEPPTTHPTVPPVTVPASDDTAAIEAVFARWLSTTPPEFADGAEMVEDFDALVETLRAAAADVGNPQVYSGQVDAVTSIDGDHADVIYSLVANGQPAYSGLRGSAVRIDGVWKVSRQTICDYVAIGRIRCPSG